MDLHPELNSELTFRDVYFVLGILRCFKNHDCNASPCRVLRLVANDYRAWLVFGGMKIAADIFDSRMPVIVRACGSHASSVEYVRKCESQLLQSLCQSKSTFRHFVTSLV